MKLKHLLVIVILLLIGYFICYGAEPFYTTDQIMNKCLNRGTTTFNVTVVSGTVYITPTGTQDVKITSSTIEVPVTIKTTIVIPVSQSGYWNVDSTTTVAMLGNLFMQWQMIGNTSFYAIPYGTYDVKGSTVIVRDLYYENIENYTIFITSITAVKVIDKTSNFKCAIMNNNSEEYNIKMSSSSDMTSYRTILKNGGGYKATSPVDIWVIAQDGANSVEVGVTLEK